MARAQLRRVPLSLGAEHAVVLVQSYDVAGVRPLAPVDASARFATPDAPFRALTLARVPLTLASLRAGRLDANSAFDCTGFRCTATHGHVLAARAVGLPCLAFLDDLSRRVGTAAIASAFALLDVPSPAIPDENEARARFVTTGGNWTLSVLDALRLARSLLRRPAPWFSVLDDALRLPFPSFDDVRGVVASDETSGWFVGYVSAAAPWIVAVHVEGCPDGCVSAALRITRWAVSRRAVAPATPRTSTAR